MDVVEVVAAGEVEALLRAAGALVGVTAAEGSGVTEVVEGDRPHIALLRVHPMERHTEAVWEEWVDMRHRGLTQTIHTALQVVVLQDCKGVHMVVLRDHIGRNANKKCRAIQMYCFSCVKCFITA